MTRRRDWITTVLDVHTAGLHGLEQCRAQIRHLGSIIEVMMDTFDQIGIADRSMIEARVEQILAARAAAERAPSAPFQHHVEHHVEPNEPVLDASAYVYAAPVAPPPHHAPMPHAPMPVVPAPAVSRTVSSPNHRVPVPTPPAAVPSPTGTNPAVPAGASAFVACAVCRKRVLRASTNPIDGVGDVCGSCLGST